ncbi:MAG: trypsin-like peptidase domain-containing protein, partial [Rhodospirillaceae bacterium]|nr:trypsin-like peptidase domain-containing protein [Rhodospirillaceae bacterium]
MKSAARIAVVALLATLTLPATARNAPDSFADLADRLSPAVVNISTTQQVERKKGADDIPWDEFFPDQFQNRKDGEAPEGRAPKRRQTSLGSGFIIDKTGYIVTNNHVIEDADQISVILEDDTVLEAKLIGRDEKVDIALLKVESKKELPTVSWGNSNQARVGDWVLAIGNPFGLSGTVTAGIISARSRDIKAGQYDDFIQTDASINPGNSGGGLVNFQGELIGINTAIIGPSGGSVGIGFAVPSSIVRTVMEQIIEYGEVRRGRLGVAIQ